MTLSRAVDTIRICYYWLNKLCMAGVKVMHLESLMVWLSPMTWKAACTRDVEVSTARMLPTCSYFNGPTALYFCNRLR